MPMGAPEREPSAEELKAMIGDLKAKELEAYNRPRADTTEGALEAILEMEKFYEQRKPLEEQLARLTKQG